MARLIQDVLPPNTSQQLPSSDKLIATLYVRGITIEQIFGKYYEYDAHATEHDRLLTVGDIELTTK
jgi:hypothetical protein